MSLTYVKVTRFVFFKDAVIR